MSAAKTILVTGATGYVGGRLLPLLVELSCLSMVWMVRVLMLLLALLPLWLALYGLYVTR